ncbi:MAG: hypothetical protein D6776_02395 [Planctomycetota bacterium]|nr:MAG: hypothetical protein D6776_02395 [Planctomycetota bacterium]
MVRWGRRHLGALALCCAALACPRPVWDALRLRLLAPLEAAASAHRPPLAFEHVHPGCAACRAREAALARAVRERDEARAELARLGVLRTVLPPERVPLLVRARVLGHPTPGALGSDRVRIAAGSRDGITLGAPALWGDALVGRVVALQPDSAELRLVTSSALRLRAVCSPVAASATAQPTAALEGIVGGDGADALWFRPDGARAPRPGDVITVSPASSLAPAGLAIGVVQRLEHDPASRLVRAIVRPLAPLSRLRSVLLPASGFGHVPVGDTP